MHGISNTMDEIQFTVDELWSNMNKLLFAMDETRNEGFF